MGAGRYGDRRLRTVRATTNSNLAYLDRTRLDELREQYEQLEETLDVFAKKRSRHLRAKEMDIMHESHDDDSHGDDGGAQKEAISGSGLAESWKASHGTPRRLATLDATPRPPTDPHPGSTLTRQGSWTRQGSRNVGRHGGASSDTAVMKLLQEQDKRLDSHEIKLDTILQVLQKLEEKLLPEAKTP